jgi:hypothetical protein
MQPQPRGLDDVLGLVTVPEQPGRDPHQPRPLRLELVTDSHEVSLLALRTGLPR